ncbi:lysophospholipase L1-like esterase [Lactobacillus colini]|uniref:Lysophospholipase L1-like esterase n=1 Tax=Lactobacillus colini TaxID=1819254 RepID=A0ABS4MEM5_9LACO|nr:SGNH/GDSL hydrolase family protein [Lactobacillus colini]MBP2058078.1 lysophospholipase L1-like esterase [Lactobacillus colini]
MQKIILYGDSILAGYRNGHATELVTESLQTYFSDHQVINSSIPGATTEEGLDFLSLKVTNLKYSAVVLGLGTNDCSVKLGLSPGHYAANLDKLVQMIGRDKIVLMGPAYTNWKIAEDHSWSRTLQFQLVAQECAKHNNLPFLDLAKAMENSNHPNDLLEDDGIHLNDEGIALLTKKLAPLIKEVLA